MKKQKAVARVRSKKETFVGIKHAPTLEETFTFGTKAQHEAFMQGLQLGWGATRLALLNYNTVERDELNGWTLTLEHNAHNQKCGCTNCPGRGGNYEVHQASSR